LAKRNRNPTFDRFIKHPLEAAGLYVLISLLRLLPVDGCSRFFGRLARAVGPRLGISRRARRNLALALPEKSAEEVEEIVRGMWHNLGQVVGEYAHLDRIAALDSGRVEVIHPEYVYALRDSGRSAILVSAHLANWEIMAPVSEAHGVDLTVIIREPNNPLVRPMVDRLRGMAGGARIPTGREGAKQALDLLAHGGLLGVLFDQKMNRGIPVEFFGHDAMTAPGLAQMALRFDCDIIPVRIERLGPARFRMTCLPPLVPPQSGDKQEDLLQIMRALNRQLEGWIRERPAEWLWLHRRWPAEAYRGLDRAPLPLKQT
jgi:KDO2-lipid IV(A) lauroyltransferase